MKVGDLVRDCRIDKQEFGIVVAKYQAKDGEFIRTIYEVAFGSVVEKFNQNYLAWGFMEVLSEKR